MDLHNIESIVTPECRADLHAVAESDAVIAGGTWLMSEPQPQIRRLVDLLALRWPALQINEHGLQVAATATIEQLVSATYPQSWCGTTVFARSADALLASYKIWQTATVGGNICLGFPAGSMISAAAALDARLLLWRRDGIDQRIAVPEFVTGIGTTVLQPGDVLRAIEFPIAALCQPTSLRKVALAPRGRSGTVVVARDTGSDVVVTITAATRRPVVRRAAGSPHQIADAVLDTIADDAFFTDPHGTADWRKATAHRLIHQTCADLSANRRSAGGS